MTAHTLNDLLLGVGSFLWTAVYLGIIFRSRKDRVPGMPAVPLALNLAWELLYTADGLIIHPGSWLKLQVIVQILWLLLDVCIALQFVKYGKEQACLPGGKKNLPFFPDYCIFLLLMSVFFQLAFYLQFEKATVAAAYSAFAQNVVISAGFLFRLMQQQDGKGHSFFIAYGKAVGTLLQAIVFTVFVAETRYYVLCMGLAIALFDIRYILALHQLKRAGKPVSFF